MRQTTLYTEGFGPDEESSILEIERLIGVGLPAAFRNHLMISGGGYLSDRIIPCSEPTPYGRHNIVQIGGVADILRTIDSDIIPRNMLCIGHGNLGIWTCLSVAGIDHGVVYSFDSEMRKFWSREKILAIPDLDPSIKKFYSQRDAGMLPARPWGYDNCYRICDSFVEFLKLLDIP